MTSPGDTALTAEEIPDEWVKAAEGGYSMHGAGLLCNILAAVAPLIAAAERERIAQLADQHRALYWYPGPPDIQGGPPPIYRSAPFADLLRDPPHPRKETPMTEQRNWQKPARIWGIPVAWRSRKTAAAVAAAAAAAALAARKLAAKRRGGRADE